MNSESLEIDGTIRKVYELTVPQLTRELEKRKIQYKKGAYKFELIQQLSDYLKEDLSAELTPHFNETAGYSAAPLAPLTLTPQDIYNYNSTAMDTHKQQKIAVPAPGPTDGSTWVLEKEKPDIFADIPELPELMGDVLNLDSDDGIEFSNIYLPIYENNFFAKCSKNSEERSTLRSNSKGQATPTTAATKKQSECQDQAIQPHQTPNGTENVVKLVKKKITPPSSQIIEEMPNRKDGKDLTHPIAAIGEKNNCPPAAAITIASKIFEQPLDISETMLEDHVNNPNYEEKVTDNAHGQCACAAPEMTGSELPGPIQQNNGVEITTQECNAEDSEQCKKKDNPVEVTILDAKQIKPAVDSPTNTSRSSNSDGDGNSGVWLLEVKGISPSTTVMDLRKLFGDRAIVLAAKIIEKSDGTIFGVVAVPAYTDALTCVQKLNQVKFDGRKLSVDLLPPGSVFRQTRKATFQKSKDEEEPRRAGAETREKDESDMRVISSWLNSTRDSGFRHRRRSQSPQPTLPPGAPSAQEKKKKKYEDLRDERFSRGFSQHEPRQRNEKRLSLRDGDRRVKRPRDADYREFGSSRKNRARSRSRSRSCDRKSRQHRDDHRDATSVCNSRKVEISHTRTWSSSSKLVFERGAPHSSIPYYELQRRNQVELEEVEKERENLRLQKEEIKRQKEEVERQKQKLIQEEKCRQEEERQRIERAILELEKEKAQLKLRQAAGNQGVKTFEDSYTRPSRSRSPTRREDAAPKYTGVLGMPRQTSGSDRDCRRDMEVSERGNIGRRHNYKLDSEQYQEYQHGYGGTTAAGVGAVGDNYQQRPKHNLDEAQIRQLVKHPPIPKIITPFDYTQQQMASGGRGSSRFDAPHAGPDYRRPAHFDNTIAQAQGFSPHQGNPGMKINWDGTPHAYGATNDGDLGRGPAAPVLDRPTFNTDWGFVPPDVQSNNFGGRYFQQCNGFGRGIHRWY